MNNLPFMLAGRSNQASASISAPPFPAGGEADKKSPGSSRRRKLWELSHKCHCPVIGVCFACDELRTLTARVMEYPRDTSDYVLHTTAVGHCEERTALAELLQKTLERRFSLSIQQFARHKTPDALKLAWQAACRENTQIPAALWCTLTHPACDTVLEQEVYADIHMLQHQLGASTRIDRRAQRALAEENRQLQQTLSALQTEMAATTQENAKALLAAQQENSKLRTELAAQKARASEFQNEALALRESSVPLAERQTLSRERDALARENSQLKHGLADKDKELLRLREFALYAEETLAALAAEDESAPSLPPGSLSGKSVLCVGGRSGAVHSYREIVEHSGGHFLHHDGGLEESLHRIDGALAAADIVICQAGCISHNAYWRVKDLCKRTGKPCLFVKRCSTTSFSRIIDEVAQTPPAVP